MLYHRVSTKSAATGTGTMAPRRIHPRELPAGLAQVVGHTGHHKCRQELEGSLGPSATSGGRGGLRTLTVREEHIRYDAHLAPALDGHATMYFIDIEMNAPEVTSFPLFELAAILEPEPLGDP